MDEKTLARFMAKVEKQAEVTSPHVDTPCWLWTGAKKAAGYGNAWNGKTVEITHRMSHRHWNGPIPAGKDVRHLCGEPSCVNPAHLTTGSRRQNMADMVRHGRSTKGERNPGSELTRADVYAIRHLWAAGMSLRQLARRFPVARGQIRRVITGESWTHCYMPRQMPPLPVETRHVGADHGRAKISDADVVAMRWRAVAGESIAAIAVDYPVSRPTVARICRGDGWKESGGPLTRRVRVPRSDGRTAYRVEITRPTPPRCADMP